jgi:hypothetical protein
MQKLLASGSIGSISIAPRIRSTEHRKQGEASFFREPPLIRSP